ncbi:hypothetical protein RQP46_006785 [Phenoliferia psychrophenolica]
MASQAAIDTIRSPLTLPCGLVLPNRTVKCPMQETLALGPFYDPPMEAFDKLYGRWANVQVDIRFLSIAGDVVIHSGSADAGHFESWKAWANLAQSQGTPCIVQIAHPGRMSPVGAGNRPSDMSAMCPSSVSVEMGNSWLDKKAVQTLLGTPREMTLEDIDAVLHDFVHAAKVSQAAGFAGIQLHAAHGFLVSQFLSPNTNRRSDAYGGTPAKRLKLMQRLLEEIREACPLPFCVSVKLNSGDYMEKGGLTQEEALTQVEYLLTCGLVDMVELSGGSAESSPGKNKFLDSFEETSIAKAPVVRESTRIREAFFDTFATQCQAIDSNVPIQLSGGFRSRLGMADAIESGTCQLLGIGRPAVLEPDFPKAVLFNPSIPDSKAFAIPFLVKGLWFAHLMPAKVVGAGLPISFYYHQMQRLGLGLQSDPSLSIPYVMGYNIMWVIKDKAAKAYSSFSVRIGSLGSMFWGGHKVGGVKTSVKA